MRELERRTRQRRATFSKRWHLPLDDDDAVLTFPEWCALNVYGLADALACPRLADCNAAVREQNWHHPCQQPPLANGKGARVSGGPKNVEAAAVGKAARKPRAVSHAGQLNTLYVTPDRPVFQGVAVYDDGRTLLWCCRAARFRHYRRARYEMGNCDEPWRAAAPRNPE